MQPDLAHTVRLMKRGNPDAVKAFYHLTSPRVFGIISHYVDDISEAKSCLKQVYLEVWRSKDDIPLIYDDIIEWLEMKSRRVVLKKHFVQSAQKDSKLTVNAIPTDPQNAIWNELKQDEQSLLIEAYLLATPLSQLAKTYGTDEKTMQENLTQIILKMGRSKE